MSVWRWLQELVGDIWEAPPPSPPPMPKRPSGVPGAKRAAAKRRRVQRQKVRDS